MTSQNGDFIKHQTSPINPRNIPRKRHEFKQLKKDVKRYEKWEPHNQKQKILVKIIETITSRDRVYIPNFFIFGLNTPKLSQQSEMDWNTVKT